MGVIRCGDRAIIDATTCDSIGTNIQGPSLVVVPDWVSEPLGRYYLYFADHKGSRIRLAYGEDIEGPWSVHRPGALQLADSGFLSKPPQSTPEELSVLRQEYRRDYGDGYPVEVVLGDAVTPHIASPDVHIDHDRQRFVMYFHGLESLGVQSTRVAFSDDGIGFAAAPAVLGPSYFRVFHRDGYVYALVMPGLIIRSRDGVSDFESGPTLFQPDMRHSAVLVQGDDLHVWWSRVGDAPESILHSIVDLSGDWMSWRDGDARIVLSPELAWEGSAAPLEPSRRGAVHERANQLRDPCIFTEGDRTWLLYSGGGESGIGLARLL